MTKRQTMKQKTKTQLERFKEAARELGCDESEERFNENLKRIAKAKQKDQEKDKGAASNDK